jgi:TonB family protein
VKSSRASFISEHFFLIAFAASLTLHLALLVGRMLSLDWFHLFKPSAPLEVIYQFDASQPDAQLLEQQVARARRDAAAAPGPANLGERMQVRIPDRPLLAIERELTESLPGPSTVIDLTNLVEASRGDPVLLSYFGAIREQIQRTADQRAWMAAEERGGLVYVSFILNAGGSVQGPAIVDDRSAHSKLLQDIALRIINEASPFPPFPPSMAQASKTIVVPLEFMAGS